MKNCIDISSYQNSLDAAKTKAAGVSHVAIKACYGEVPQPSYPIFAQECKENDMPISAYYFAVFHYDTYNGGSFEKAREEMRKEVKVFISLLKQQGVTGWAAIDQELESSNGHRMGLDKDQNTILLQEACDLIRAAGFHPCLYAGANWLMQHVNIYSLDAPLWVAYYYNDPNDPDFDTAVQYQELTGRYADFMKEYADRICMWQFGRIGYGQKYGTAHAQDNVDRNFLYFLPEEENKMQFTPSEGKQLVVTSAEKPTCQIFNTPDTTDLLGNLPKDAVLPVLAVGEEEAAGGIIGRWYKVEYAAAPSFEAYVWAASDRCRIEDVPAAPPEAPAEGIPEIKPAYNRDKEIAKRLREIADLLEG